MMSGMLGAFSWLFGGSSIVSITLIGMLVLLLFRPERIVKRASFGVAQLLVVVAIALPALLILFSDAKGLGQDDGIFARLCIAAATLCSAGAVYFLIDSFDVGHSSKQ